MYEDHGQRYSDSKLYLLTVTDDAFLENKYYKFLWIVEKYSNIQFNIQYVCHCICIGGVYHFLRIKRYVEKEEFFYADHRNRLRVELLLDIEPHQETAFKFKYSGHSTFPSEETPFITPNGHLEVFFEILVSPDKDLFLPLLESEQSFKVTKHMDTMFTNGQYTDISIYVGEKIFNAHKAVLATRSKVFERMLEAHMKEKADNRITIQDCESEIFGEFLNYLYSNKLNLSRVKSAVELYKLAEQYDLPDLKFDSSIFLARNLNADNVIQILKLADLHEDSKLKKATMDYMFQNISEVMKSPCWPSFLTSTSNVESLFSDFGMSVSECKVFKDYRLESNQNSR